MATLQTERVGGMIAPGIDGAVSAAGRPAARRPGSATRFAAIAGFLLAALGSAGCLVIGAGATGAAPRTDLIIIGGIGALLVLTLGPVALLLARLRDSMDSTRLARTMEQLGTAVQTLSDHAVLSDDARRLLNRRGERSLLCRAIEEDIAAEEWDAAIVLCNELADRFGFRAEAEQFRAQIEQARSVVQERRIADAIAQLDGLIVQRRWEIAFREAARITRLYPESPRVATLHERVERARAVYKADLERRFLDAAGQEHVEQAMDLLKELDQYLTETEAAPFREVARGVIGKARDNLGAQFKIAVQDRQWAAAAAIGRRIINEFPNTRMAQEVREHLDNILAKANGSA